MGTLKTVLLGFVILIIIVGAFYGVICWDKMKDNGKGNHAKEVTANGTISMNLNQPVVSSESAKTHHLKEEKTFDQK